jgi:hypothetical protein
MGSFCTSGPGLVQAVSIPSREGAGIELVVDGDLGQRGVAGELLELLVARSKPMVAARCRLGGDALDERL